ncbi:MAG TPA: Hint domain-containing protein, partial [Rhodopila sp.]|nr:Hint domain-containing protein [Rhodopila sp.]
NNALTIESGSLSGTGGLTTIYTDPLQYTLGVSPAGPDVATLGGLALDAQAGQLYYAQATEDYNTGAAVAASTGIYRISVNGGSPTLITATSAGIQNPTYVALDSTHNLLFFTDAILPGGSFPAVNNLDVVNLSTGSITILKQFSSADANFLLGGLAVDTVNNKIYLTSSDHSDLTSGSNAIYSIPYTVSGSGSSAQASIGAVTTLYSGSGAYGPFDIRVDPAKGVLYTSGAQPASNPDFYGAVFAGSVNGGSSLTVVDSLTTLTNSTAALDDAPQALVLLTQPTVTASGTVIAITGQGPVTVDPGLLVATTDGQQIATATVSGILSGDTLSYNGGTAKTFTDGGSIASTFSAGTLTLSGVASAADYQSALDSVTFTTTSGDTTARTLNWTVNDGAIVSPTATSTIDLHTRPTITAGATATFIGGGTAVTLDAGLTISAASSTTLASATVTVGGYINGDTLSVGTPGGLLSKFSNGTLTLTGSASIATYQAALDSITYGFSPANGNPTAGGNTSRGISWSVNDGTVSSAAAGSTLDVVHANPTVIAGGSATYPENAAPVALDTGLTVTDPDSGGNLTGATVSITSGFLSGDTLTFTDQNGITGSYNSATGVLTLTGTATIAQYQTALQSVGYSFAGDPTNSGVDNGRTIGWSVTDGSGASSLVTSSLTTLCFCPGTLIMTPRGEVPVEQLATGDEVLTASGARRAITWIGQGRVLATRGRRTAATPVIVRKHALGPNVPHRDLRITKAHALFLEDVLIPVEFLVNHRSILWDDHAQEVRLYHIELSSHDVLLANGAPAESYRDDGNRWLFQNANKGWGLPPQEPCAPVLTGGPVVDAIWRRLLDQAGPRQPAPLTDDPDLHLLVQGQPLNPIARHEDMYVFRLPASPGSVRIRSRAAAPQELGTSRDPRVLGVAIQRMVLAQGGRQRTVTADAASLNDGYHAYEPETGLRWTDGDAAVPPALFAGYDKPWMLMLYLGGRTQYCEDGVSIRAA